MTAQLETLIDAALAVLAPPAAPRTLLAFAESLVLPERIDGGHEPKPYEPALHPAHLAVLSLMADPRWRRLVIMAPAQDGKTTLMAAILLHALIERRQPAVYACTDHRLGANIWQSKIRPMMERSGHGQLLPDTGKGSGGAAVDTLLLGNGARFYRLGGGASNGAGQAGISGWLIVIDEAGKIRPAQRSFLEDRGRAWPDSRVLLGGTREHDDHDQLAIEYEASTGGALHYPWPCGHWAPIAWPCVKYTGATKADVAASLRLHCPVCEAAITEPQRLDLLRYAVVLHRGQEVTGPAGAPVITGEPTAARTAGLRWTCCDSPLRNLSELAWEEVGHRATARLGDHQPMRQFHHAELVTGYSDGADTLAVASHDLAVSAAQGLTAGVAPPDADLLTGAIDVQWRRLYWLIMAYRSADRSWWIVDHGRHAYAGDGDQATPAQLAAGLDQVRDRMLAGAARPGLAPLPLQLAAVDTADGHTRDGVLAWLAGRPDWLAVRGQSDHQAADLGSGQVRSRLPGVLTVYDHQTNPRHTSHAIAVDILKGDILRALRRKPGTPGAGHIPRGEASDGELLRELAAERLELGEDGKARWVKTHRHNHRLDCAVYAYALARWISSGQAPSAAAMPIWGGVRR